MTTSQLKIPTDLLYQFRHMLHKFPEVSNHEKDTGKRVLAFLNNYNPTTIIENLGEKSLAVVFGNDSSSTTIMVRCELDALPIKEMGKKAYASEHEGVSHMCGHDGHMAIVAGLGAVLSRMKPKDTRVVLLFQHAEEVGDGAIEVLEDPAFKKIYPDYVLALHNVPGYPLHQVVLKKGSFTPAVTSIIITLNGKTSHAAEPEMGINPAMAIAKIVQLANELEINNDTEKFRLLTPIQIEMGEEAYGVSAGDGIVKYTLRAWTDERLSELKNTFVSGVTSICKEEKIAYNIDWAQPFSANQNDENIIDEIEKAAHTLDLSILKKETPFKWGEDFGLFTQHFPGALFGLGAGENTPALHNPDYDFPDEIIETGINVFYETIQQLANR